MFKILAATSITVVAIALSLAVLQQSNSSPNPLQAAEKLNQEAKKLNEQIKQTQTLQSLNIPPSIIDIEVDQSGSMTQAKTNSLTWTDLNSVLTAQAKTGGTFALGKVCALSDSPKIRLKFDQSPQITLKTLPPPPQLPDTSKGSPFKHRELLAQYQENVNTYRQLMTQQQQQLTQLESHYQVNLAKINQIKPQIEVILIQPRNCQATDLQNAIKRANIVLNEPHQWTTPPRKYVVFISDGLDSFSTESAKLDADQVIIVNGSNQLGIFQNIDHQRFESPQAALEKISADLLQ